MKYPIAVNVTCIQMSEDDDIHVTVSTREASDSSTYISREFRIRPLDTPSDTENYVMMAVAAVCEAL